MGRSSNISLEVEASDTIDKGKAKTEAEERGQEELEERIEKAVDELEEASGKRATELESAAEARANELTERIAAEVTAR